MIAADTSTWIAYFAGHPGADVEILDELLLGAQAVLPPVVLTELLSAPALSRQVEKSLLSLKLLEPIAGHWQRAGSLRSKILAQGRKARLADTLIATSCIDHDVPLLTRDNDFKSFVRAGGLRLVR